MKIKWLIMLLFLSGTIMAQSQSRGIELYNDGKLDEAQSFFSKDQSSETSIYYLGRIAFDKEEFRKAADYFEEAIEINQKSDYYTWLGNSLGSYTNEVNFFRKGILAPKIKSAYEKAVELDARNIDAHWGLIEYYTQAPSVMGGSFEKAEETANAIKKVDVLEGHSALATVYTRQDEHDKAEKEYIAAAELDKSRLLNLGFYYQRREAYDKAFSAFESAYENDEDNLGALYQIGRTSALSGKKTEKGISSLQKYLAIEWKKGTPSHAGALMRLGMIYEKTGDKSKAISHYEKSLAKDPEMEEAKKGLNRLK